MHRISEFLDHNPFTALHSLDISWHLIWPLPILDEAQAPCKHVVQLAKAEVESRQRDRVSPALRDFARIRLADAERGMQRVLKGCGLMAPVHVEYFKLPEGMPPLPYVRLSSWVRLLMDTKRFPRQFCVVASFEKLQPVLAEFWSRFEKTNGQHPIFNLARLGKLSLDCTVPYYTHTDEGRTYKHSPLWVMSSAGVLGRGTRSYLASGKHTLHIKENGMGMNYPGKTWTTQFLFSTMTKKLQEANPEAVDGLMKIFASDAKMLLEEGISVDKGGERRLHLIHLGTKGDLPALRALSGAKRSFSQVPRAASSKRPCAGICPLCDAGQEQNPQLGLPHIPFEDVNTGAAWISTLHAHPPWETPPTILEGLGLSTADSMAFFLTDPWHNLHLGVLKRYIAGSMVAIVEAKDLPSMPRARSVDSRFAWLTGLYLAYWPVS